MPHHFIGLRTVAIASILVATALFAPAASTVENLPAAEVSFTEAELGAKLLTIDGTAPTLTVYYGTSDGGTTAGSWAGSVSLGYTLTQEAKKVTGLQPGTLYYFRAFGSGATGTDWADSTGSFSTLVATTAVVTSKSADSISAVSAQIRGEITSDGGQSTSITMYWGTADGGTNPGGWEHSRNLGPQTKGFATILTGLTPTTTYHFRSSAVNGSGTTWAPDSSVFTTTNSVPQTVVINEVHYDPPDPTKLIEFVELHNPTASAIDISGWVLKNGVDFTFPPGTSISAGGYRVVCQNVAAFTAQWPTVGTPLGPWAGKLGDGERLELETGNGTLVDEVDYNSGFPWPTSANGGGTGGGESIQLLHPALDNSLGGSWRSASGLASPPVYIPLGDPSWRYKKGREEASGTATAPTGDWRLLNFAEGVNSLDPATDEPWQNGDAPIGYGDPPFTTTPNVSNTVITDMQNSYQCIFFRHKFTINGPIPDRLSIKLAVDDECMVWINGVQVITDGTTAADGLATYVAPNVLAFRAPTAAQMNIGTFGYVDNGASVTRTLTGLSSILQPGTNANVIAVQVWNPNLTSSDMYFDCELTGEIPGATTPNATNTAAVPSASAAPPAIRGVDHSPKQPAAGTPVVVTAVVTDLDNVSSVSLDYQTVDPGSYIRKADPAYATSWTSLAMTDDGTGGDAVAGDSIYSVTIPGAVQTHRRLIRYRITAADALANSIRVPYNDDEQPNFAYFCYNGIPGWSGAFSPGSTPIQNFPASLLQSIPTYHLIANEADILNTQYNPATPDTTRFQGALVYDGVVYDHINYHIRGIGSTRVSGKNKWSFLFNRSRDFEARDNWGRKYEFTWNSLKVGANASPWCAVHRGSAGVEEATSQRLFEIAGVPSAKTHYFQLRIIRRATELNAAGTPVADPLGTAGSLDGQYSSDLWGLYLAIEPIEGNFLDERNLPDGNICSVELGNGDVKHQGATQPAGNTDYGTFKTGFNTTNQVISWYQTNMDLNAFYTWMGVSRLCGNVDVRPGDNYFFYHRSSDSKWVIMPYDLDMMFLPAHHWGTNTIIDGELPTNTNPAGYDFTGANFAGVPESYRAITRHPALALESRNRARELLDLLASDAAVDGGQIGQLIDEYAQIVNPTGAALTWADIDNTMWNGHPRTTGGNAAPPAAGSVQSGQTNHRFNFLRAAFSDSRGNLNGITQTNYNRSHSDPNADGYAEFEEKIKYFTEYATNTWPGGTWVRSNGNQRGYGYKYLEWESLYSGLATHQSTQPAVIDQDFPNTPTITAIGASGFPANDLRFHSGIYSDPQGAHTISAVQWRLGEISAPGLPFYDPSQPRIYEIGTVWTSGEVAQADPVTIPDVRIPATAVRAGHIYRARVRHKDATGRWSHWSAPIQFAVGLPDVSVYQQDLMITEIMYHPQNPSGEETTAGYTQEDFEFIELTNVGAQSLDLTDVRFTKGIDFDFPAGTSLAGGAKIYVVKNPAAFAFRYGVDRVVAGNYGTNNLANAGEELKLSYGTGAVIHYLTYLDSLPWPVAADGQGYSLQLVDPPGRPDHSLPQSWRAGLAFADWKILSGLGQSAPGTAENEDFDHDGISNRLEYALNGDPLAPSTSPWPVGAVDGSGFMTLEFTLQAGASDVAYFVEFSTDLATWQANGSRVASVDHGDGTLTEMWRAPAAIPAGQRMYGRVRIE